MSNYKTGDKFVIELGEQVGDLWKIKGFTALAFDANWLNRLSPLEDQNSRKKGQEEAWELIKKMRHDMKKNDVEEAFGVPIPDTWNHVAYINEFFTYAEAAAKVEAWEQKKKAPKLTLEESAFCEIMGNGFIARDKSGYLYCSWLKPTKLSDRWDFHANYRSLSSAYFPFIKWDDEEPWSIKDLLNLEVDLD